MVKPITQTIPMEPDGVDGRGAPSHRIESDPIRGSFPFWGRSAEPEPQPKRIETKRGKKAVM